MKYFIPFLIALFFAGCGYKPSSEFARSSIGESVYVQVAINAKEAQSTPYVKDAMIESVIRRFHSKAKSEELADTVIFIRVNGVNFSPLNYDSNGYVISYKSSVNISVRYKKKGGHFNVYNTTGTYDFSVEPNSVISDVSRDEAIKIGTDRAIDSFISYLSAKGIIANDP